MKQSILMLMLFLISCCSIKNNTIEIGCVMPKVEIKSEIKLMVSPSKFEICKEVKFDDIDYLIATDDKNTITKIFTYDTNFMSPDSVRVGMKLSEIMNKQKSELNLINGWAYVIHLKSGWNAAFELSDYDKQAMSADSIVKWIYKK
jgi:hypothetical protein